MSKLIYIVLRDKEAAKAGRHIQKIRKICDGLNPDNIRANASGVSGSDGIFYGISNPVDSIPVKGNSILMGQVFTEADRWHLPNTEAPDGSYAIFRADENFVEMLSDYVASRTIWYFFNDELFIAATSQRAIIHYLGFFNFNEEVIPWVLSTGSLGPQLSWDRRLKMIPGDTCISLNRLTWKLEIKSQPVNFQSSHEKEINLEEGLRQRLIHIFRHYHFDQKKWILPLSGGYDSRGILCLIKAAGKETGNLRTVTWGLQSSLQQKDNDAYIAKQLATALNVQHEYFLTDLSAEPVDRIIKRFLNCGEGRIDHIAAYMDGFHIWKTFFENGIEGTVRGDEGFGWLPVSSEYTLRVSLGLKMCSDFDNLKNYRDWGIAEQTLPQSLRRRNAETLDSWRDRLYHQYRIPIIIAALSDLKFAYIDQSDPLLSKTVLEFVRTLPDKLRTDKALFKKIVQTISPDVPYAKTAANASPKDILKTAGFISLMKAALLTDTAAKLFSPELLQRTISNLKTVSQKKPALKARIKSKIIKWLPISFRNRILDKKEKSSLDNYLLGFRMFIIIEMYKLLSSENA